PQDASIILDRRLALGETEDMISKEMDGLVAGTKGQWRFCDIPASSWTGMDFVFHSFLPAWNIEPEHPLVAAASQAYRLVKDGEPVLFRMGASTNGVTTAGMFHLPTIVFGPGDLAQAHSTNEYCSVESMLDACRIYAALCGRIEKL
ncbi:MAG: M20/M25/M40 family metallo-hydrolase, partial [Hungatella hathewayi]